MNEEFLMHHGIKGMRWGVRRFQNNDGSLTPAGKKRYNVDIEGAEKKLEAAKKAEKQAKSDYNRASLSYNYNATFKAAKKYTDSLMKTDWARQDLQSEKIKQKLNTEQKAKSNHRVKLEQGYLDKGMTKEEAEIAAYKRERTEKIIAVTAGLTVAAAATYVAYKQYDKRVDKILNSGTILQNISNNSNRGVSDAFYASMTKMDNTKYRGVYGDNIRSLGHQVYETKIGLSKNVKIASEKHAVEALSELVKGDTTYAKKLQSMGAQNVMVTLGDLGAVLACKNGESYTQNAPKGKVISAVGSGDSAIAAFLAKHISGGDYADCLKLAVAAGSATAFSDGLAKDDKIKEIYKTI